MIVMLMMCGCEKQVQQEDTVQKTEASEIRAVWIYYDELSMKNEKNANSQSFEQKITKMLDNCSKHGINTVFVQVRPFCDAFYKSELFPPSVYLSGEQGKDTGYDALQICIEKAHERGISVHAWINPFRVMYYSKKFTVSKTNPSYDWIENDSKNIIKTDDGIFMCPASYEVQKLVIDGVREIAENYDVDGIHIDDYFYPTTDESADSSFYKTYTESGGKLTLDEWRRANISALVSAMYSTVKSKNEDCIFSISPQGNIDNNQNSQYADVKMWCSEKGYADWIIPQIYYSFDNTVLPFDKAVGDWNKIKSENVKIIWGIALYKIGNDFDENEISKQIEYLKSLGSYDGVAYFSYSQLEKL